MPADPPLAAPLLDAAGARAGDAAAVEAGESWAGLMATAAGHLARHTVRMLGGGYGRRIAIVVGTGNNGGDGWAAASRLTARFGAQVWVVAPHGTEVALSAEASAARAAWLRAGGRVTTTTASLSQALAWADIAVDAVLGTGIRGQVRGEAREATRALRRAHDAGLPVIACDIPSGVDADTGQAADDAVVADRTVTFGAAKRGLLLHPGAAHAGDVEVVGLGPGFADHLATRAAAGGGWWALTPAGAAPPPYDPATDKRGRGTVLAVAGAAGTSGAAALCASAALVAGAGLVTVATPAAVRGEVAARTDPGVMVQGVGDGEVLASGALDGFGPLQIADVVVAGPGLGVHPGAAAVVADLRARAPRLVLDADALNVHRDEPQTLGDHVGELVLTPHARELARIGGGDDAEDAWANRAARVPALAARLGATIVAKGPGTMVAAPDGRVWVCPRGGPSLGSGGTGDVLAGIVAAAIARADDVPLAVARAVWWHARAGEHAGDRHGGRGTAQQVLAFLPDVLGELATTTSTVRTPRWA